MEKIIAEISRSTAEIGKLLYEHPSVLFLKPSIEEWSVLECVTHLCLLEEHVLGLVLVADERVDGPVQTWDEGKMKHILVTKREHRYEAPDLFVPRNEFLDAEEAFEHLRLVRSEFERVLSEQVFIFDGRLFPHPRLGMLTRLDWLWFIVAHADRHLLQMRDIVSVLISR